MKLNFRHFGEGKPLIILHGLFGQSDNWVTVGRRMATHFSVFIPDLRNHGLSPHAPVHTYPAMADDLLEFMEDHELEEVILLGHSMGGKTAMTFALEHPGLVEKLIIVDISLRKYPERNIHTRVISEMMSIDLNTFRTRSDVEKRLESTMDDARIRMFILKNLYYKMPGQLAWRLNLEAINHNMEQLFVGIPGNSAFNGPALFVKGGLSDYILDEDIPLIQERFPHFVLKNIPGATHWVHADAPGELCRLLSDFLQVDCRL